MEAMKRQIEKDVSVSKYKKPDSQCSHSSQVLTTSGKFYNSIFILYYFFRSLLFIMSQCFILILPIIFWTLKSKPSEP